MSNRRIVRSNAMREATAREIRAALARRKPYRNQPEVVNTHYSRAPLSHARVGPDILLTGGIGDFIAIESFFSPQERSAVQRVYLATRASGPIMSILRTVPIFPSCQSVISLHEDWSKVFCVLSLEDFFNKVHSQGWAVNLNMIPKGVIDLSISTVFPQIANGYRKFHRCGFLDHRLADVGKFELPGGYAFIQPYSPNDRQGGERDYTAQEWQATLDYLRRNDLKGVVVLNSEDYVPDDPNLINLANQTSIVEAMEIAKNCHTYIGVDSCFAALVSKFLPRDRLFVKSVNQHYLDNVLIYAAPHYPCDFVYRDLSEKLAHA